MFLLGAVTRKLNNFSDNVIYFHSKLEAQLVELLVSVGTANSLKEVFSNKIDRWHNN